jgi:tetrahydromethanopterin S-methyltransferase subunit G|tara:strand:+ start:1020 stop:1256 length:237 start_codon:yes stop_codon:yes gene_type:complete
MARATDLEKQNLEAHVDLCEQRYNNLEKRLGKVEEKVQHIHDDLGKSHSSLIKVIIGTSGTIIAGLLSTVVVILINMS